MSAAGQVLAVVPSQPGVRRLSSITATREDLARGPSVVVPPKDIMACSDAHETAAAMEIAKHHLDGDTPEDSMPSTPAETTVTDKFAYAFDIDGVLIRGGKPIPEAVEAMKMLNGENEWGIKVYDLDHDDIGNVLTNIVHTSLLPMEVGRLSKSAACN